MLIVLEGTDGAGKSTLANQLAAEVETHGEDVEILHAGPPQPGVSVFKQYAEPLLERREKIARRDYLLILDRWHLGELIYGPLLRGKSSLEPEQFAYLELLLESLGAVKVIVSAHRETLMSRLGPHREDLVNVEQAITINDQFIGLAMRYRWGILSSGRDPFNTITELFGHLDHENLAARVLGQFPGYVGSVAPNLLLVGDEPNGWSVGEAIRPAFYPDVLGSSSNYLLRSLLAHGNTINAGFCNANDGTDVKNLWRTLDRPLIVALGRSAGNALDQCGLGHTTVPHPQWVRRFHHRSHVEYGRAILAPVTLDLRVSNGELVTVPAAVSEAI